MPTPISMFLRLKLKYNLSVLILFLIIIYFWRVEHRSIFEDEKNVLLKRLTFFGSQNQLENIQERFLQRQKLLQKACKLIDQTPPTDDLPGMPLANYSPRFKLFICRVAKVGTYQRHLVP